jgi:hypothetical protein
VGKRFIDIQMNIDSWEGKSIRALSCLDSLLKIFGAEKNYQKHVLELSINDISYYATLALNTNDNDWLAEIANFLKIIKKARDIAARINIHPKFTRKISQSDAAEIERIYSLLQGDIIQKNMPRAKFIALAEVNKQLIIPESFLVEPLTINGAIKTKLFGEDIVLDNYEGIISDMRFIGDVRKIKNAIKNGAD